MSLQYHIDHVNRVSGKLKVIGWAVNTLRPEKTVQFDIRKGNKTVPFQINRTERKDVIQSLFQGKDIKYRPGFEMSVQMDDGDSCQLLIHSGLRKAKIYFTPESIRSMMFQEEQERIKMEENLLRQNPEQAGVSYGLYQKLTALSESDLQKQRERDWNQNAPFFSIVVPLYETPAKALQEMILSVLHQTYGKWELCLADGSKDDSAFELVKEISHEDQRIRYQHLSSNKGISENTNAAIRMAEGDYIVFCDHDDLLTENALYEMADAIEKNPEVNYLYSDEDKTDADGQYFFEGHFKSDFNPDLLRTTNYISHLSVVRKEFIEKIGNLRKEYDGAQDYDLVLRASENTEQFIHIPKVLYHWRVSDGSTASGTVEKSYASDAGRKAVMDHWKRKYPELKIENVEWNSFNGTYHTIFSFSEEPLVSVILVGKNETECINSLKNGKWQNLEFMPIEQLEKARGEYFLFIKTYVRMKNEESIKELTGYAQRRDTGVIGSEIFYQDGTIASAGILMGINGSYGNAFEGQNPEIQNTYFSRDSEVQNLSAVSDHAFMIRRNLFLSLNGFDERFQSEGKVIDLCLRCRKQGLWNVYDPYASFVTLKTNNAFMDQNEMRLKYSGLSEYKDPYYNLNLTHKGTDFSCRNPQGEQLHQ